MSEDDRKVSFHHKKVAPRAAIVAAGPIANFLLAIVIFAGLFTFFGKPSASARVDTVQADSAAAAAGIQPGDVITAIDGSGDRKLLRHAADRLDQGRAGADASTIKRGDTTHRHPRDAEPARGQGQFRQHASASACSALRAPARRKTPRTRRSIRSRRVGLGREGDLVRGRPDAGLYRRRVRRPGGGRPDRRPDPNRPDFGSGFDHRHGRPDPSCRGAVGLDRAA